MVVSDKHTHGTPYHLLPPAFELAFRIDTKVLQSRESLERLLWLQLLE